MLYYGIRNRITGYLAGWEYVSNGDAEFSTSVQFLLTNGDEGTLPRIVTSYEDAFNALNTYVDWYNADYYITTHDSFSISDHDVVELDF